MSKILPRFLVSFLSSIFFVGCETTAPTPPAPLQAFNEVEYIPFIGTGTGAIEGQAFSRTRGGDIKYAAGSEVVLTPATTHGVDWAQRSYNSDKWHQMDPQALQYTKTTTADGLGNFRFDGLPSGEYIILTSVFWEYPRSAGRTVYMSTTGGFLVARASVQEGRISSVVVN